MKLFKVGLFGYNSKIFKVTVQKVILSYIVSLRGIVTLRLRFDNLVTVYDIMEKAFKDYKIDEVSKKRIEQIYRIIYFGINYSIVWDVIRIKYPI